VLKNGETWLNPFQQQKQAKDCLNNRTISWGMASLVIGTLHYKKIEHYFVDSSNITTEQKGND